MMMIEYVGSAQFVCFFNSYSAFAKITLRAVCVCGECLADTKSQIKSNIFKQLLSCVNYEGRLAIVFFSRRLIVLIEYRGRLGRT